MILVNGEAPPKDVQEEIEKVKAKKYAFELKHVPFDADANVYRPPKEVNFENYFVRKTENNETQIVTYYENTRVNREGVTTYLAQRGYPKLFIERGRLLVDGGKKPDLVWWLQNNPDYDRLYVLHDKMEKVRKNAAKRKAEYTAQQMILDEYAGVPMSALRDVLRSYGETGVENMDDNDVQDLLLEKVDQVGAQEFINRVDTPMTRVIADVHNAVQYEVVIYNEQQRFYMWYNPETLEKEPIKRVPAGINDPLGWFAKYLVESDQDTLDEIKSRLIRARNKAQDIPGMVNAEKTRNQKEKESPREKVDKRQQSMQLTKELNKLDDDAKKAEKENDYDKAIKLYKESLEVNSAEDRTQKQQDLYEDAKKGIKRCEGKLAEA